MLNDFRAVLKNRDFMVALAGRSASVFGDEVALVALILRLQAEGGHPYQVAVLLGAGLLPFVLLARVAGRVADTVDSRRVLVCATVAQACCCVPLVFTGNPVVMFVFAGLLGCGAAFAQATWQALVPRIVGEDAIGAAIGAQQTSVNLALVLAPATAGLLAGAFGTRVPVAIDAITFGAMTAAAVAVRTRRAGGRPVTRSAQGGGERAAERDGGHGHERGGGHGHERGGGHGSERGGWGLLRADPVLGPLVIGLAAFVLLGFTVNVVLVFLVRQTLHASAAWYGGVGATWVLGIVGGALASGRITSGRASSAQAVPGQIASGRAGAGHIRAALAGAGLMSLAFAGYGLVPSVVLLVPVSILGGVGNGMVNVCVATLVMTRSEERVRGRVSAALGAVVNAASVAALAAGGGLAAVLAPRQIFLLAGGCGGLVTLVTTVRVPGAVTRVPRPATGVSGAPVSPCAARARRSG
jgi:MFS family permease